MKAETSPQARERGVPQPGGLRSDSGGAGHGQSYGGPDGCVVGAAVADDGSGTVTEADSTTLASVPLPNDRSRTTAGGLRIAKFVARRVLAGIVTLFVVSALVFFALNILPGNVATAVLGQNATPESTSLLEAQLGLDQPVAQRYVYWLGDALQGDLGDSAVGLVQNSPEASISSSIRTPLLNSLILAGLTTILLVPLTLLLGGLAGVYAGRKLDHAISLPSLIFAALPEFVTATLLIVVFFGKLNILPPLAGLGPGDSPLSNLRGQVLPVVTLLMVALASGVRQVRAGMIEVMDRDYFNVARLNGLRGHRLLMRYALRNALAPSVQTLAQNIQYLVGGIIIVETVFNFPGIGSYLVQAVDARDVPVVQATAVILAAVYIAINIVADLVVVLLVPRLRTQL
jgi:peptide/nickel transport system permease protein